ncbi:MAG: hypothetical protein ABI634_14765 [Acidobacteriota bacterium]
MRLVAFAKLTGGPGSLRLLGILITIGLIWVVAFPRRRSVGFIGLALVAISYLVMATPLVAQWTAARLPPAEPVRDVDIRNIETLFIFDGDNRWGRLRETQRIYDLAQPREVVLLGRLSVYKDLLLMPIPRERLHHDATSWNTSSQVERVKELWRGESSGPTAILASCLQAPRVKALLHDAGLNLTVLSAPLDADLPQRGVRRIVPSLAALATTRDALYEVAALSYYGG